LGRFSLEGKTALVTGGASGLGRACCLALAGAGANIAVIGTREPEKVGVIAEIQSMGKKAVAYQADVCDEAAVAKVVAQVAADFGGIDILINSAGVAATMPVVDFDLATWERIMDINVKGLFLFSRETAKQMLKQGRGGRIINISSLQGSVGRKGDPAYAASKAAVNLMTKSMACEWAQDGITVNAIAPTWCWTEMTEAILAIPEFYEQLKVRLPQGRAGDLEDLFGITVFLASETAAFINGTIIPLDGGGLACDGFPVVP
jgi:NAD(P)-dependent dehydrogenase (short-subunit alcohol dehydrogenase family)